MKSDTQYFHDAVAKWTKANKYAANLPVTPNWFSEMLRDAQAMKDADKARIDADGTTA